MKLLTGFGNCAFAVEGEYASGTEGAPVTGAAVDSGHFAGVVGGLAQLEHAVERAAIPVPINDATTQHLRTDSKAYKVCREKKLAAGHKPDDHEDEEMTMEQTMKKWHPPFDGKGMVHMHKSNEKMETIGIEERR